MTRAKNFAAACFVATAALACDGSDGVGSVVVTISGEEASVAGFPVGAPPDQLAFADSWTMQFEKVLVSITDFRLEATDGDDAMVAPDPIVVDLHRGDQSLFRIESVGARRWDEVSYRYGAPTAASRLGDGVARADVDSMVASGTSILIEGTASDGTETIAFIYAFALAVDNHGCHNGIDETAGIIVRDNATTEAQITIHLDHLFFDSYAIDEPSLRFEPMAAMATGGMVSLAALAGQALSAPVDREGMPIVDDEGSPVIYDPGPLTLATNDLAGYVLAAATTTGHFNGEGHCDYRIE